MTTDINTYAAASSREQTGERASFAHIPADSEFANLTPEQLELVNRDLKDPRTPLRRLRHVRADLGGAPVTRQEEEDLVDLDPEVYGILREEAERIPKYAGRSAVEQSHLLQRVREEHADAVPRYVDRSRKR